MVACRHSNMLVVLSMLASGGASSPATEPVTIVGGADASGHQYSWTMTNASASPIVEVRFPHYRASLFFAPDGWTTDCSAQVGIGGKDEPGVCTGRAGSSTGGIAVGRSAVFRMQIASAGAKRFPGNVTVRFADGTETTVGGVELPTREGAGDKYTSLAGLGTVFLVLVIVQARRRRRNQEKPG